jgi:hypothetical protein
MYITQIHYILHMFGTWPAHSDSRDRLPPVPFSRSQGSKVTTVPLRTIHWCNMLEKLNFELHKRCYSINLNYPTWNILVLWWRDTRWGFINTTCAFWVIPVAMATDLNDVTYDDCFRPFSRRIKWGNSLLLSAK